MNLVDLTGTYCAAMKNSDNSRFNILSAIVSYSLAMAAVKDGESSIGIITPYAAQTRLIRAILQDAAPEQKGRNVISCATVHQFQGSERNVIVFDAVESYPSPQAGWLMSKNDNGSLMRLVNVALTRARGKFAAVADSRFWITKYKEKPNDFYRLLEYVSKQGNTMRIRSYGKNGFLESELPKGPIKVYPSLKEAVNECKRDITAAKQTIVISIPDGKLDSASQGELFQQIVSARVKGINILIKSNDYKSLPEQWKPYTWGTENATFPLILIDDKVLWYGLPLSQGVFTDHSNSFKTIHPVFIRMTGKKSVAMIKSLSDLEYRQVNGKRAAFMVKTSKDVEYEINQTSSENGLQAGGLARYLSQKEFCYRCKTPMKMVKGRRSIYLKCPKCEERRFIKVQQIQLYIDMEHVRCPKDKCELTARLGSYGLYIQCEAGHTLKPEEL